MEEIIPMIIRTKLQIAETEDESLHRSRLLKDIYEKIAASDLKISDLSREIQSLLRSIEELIAEKNSYRANLEQNKENTEHTRSPDQFLEIPTDVNGIDAWARVLADFDSPQSLKKLRTLSRRGIPTKIRGELWSKIVGNDLFLTQKLFSSLLDSSKKCGKNEQEENGTVLIPMDLRRTLSNLQVFQEKQPLHSSLSDLLRAFAVRIMQVYRPDMGYVQGMAYLGAIFVLHENTYTAFCTFSNMIFKSHMLRSFYSFNLPVMQSYYKVFEYYMKKKVPAVLEKFKDLGITPDMFLLEWVYTLFSRCLDIENVR
jgi:hypothetical protein